MTKFTPAPLVVCRLLRGKRSLTKGILVVKLLGGETSPLAFKA
ncbi:hypothetical protein CP97_13105 [Aurantiacibacter atlanticus]|uniref:Uncharacterized protein n=1 Tax=Aurantiacibacter atlanticus TaxID=1648404 RepID=A0A0H4VIL3_9SPHN|nr:hypothetical protein CP97_13105 [Aurantiacibacter atlanticus]